MALDIRSGLQVAVGLAILFFLLSIWGGVRSIQTARRLPFFRMRRQKMMRGWQLLGWGVLLAGLAVFLNTAAEPLIYRVFPPTATPSITPTASAIPTITLTPTITVSPTITPTPSVTDTPTITPTPFVPLAVELEFLSTVTPQPGALVSDFTFTEGIDEEYRPLNPGTAFVNPVSHMYALFTYNQMTDGVQWTALWYRNGELVFFETKPWDGGTGGLGYTDWDPAPAEWLPGTYEVQMFVGLEFVRGGGFTVEGEPPTPEPSATASRTPIPTKTPRPTAVPPTERPTRTPRPTAVPPTERPTRTPRPTAAPSLTPTITLPPTAYLSPTPTLTRTRWPTLTRTATGTPRPTFTPSKTPTATRTRRPYYTPTRTLTRTPFPTWTRTPVTPSRTPWPTLTRTPTPP